MASVSVAKLQKLVIELLKLEGGGEEVESLLANAQVALELAIAALQKKGE